MIANGIPLLLLEVSSDSSETDKDRMLLQASCLVRLGNALMEKPEFLVKAIYIDDNFKATEFTLFQSADPVFIVRLLPNDS
jgi:hypothetical protein